MGAARRFNPKFLLLLLQSIRAPFECWPWPGHIGQNGYPYIGRVPAYRRAWERLVGPIPARYEVDHLCRNPLCVNPFHLEPVPPRVNNLRSASPAAKYAERAACSKGHAFTPKNTWIRGSGARVCRQCRRENMRRYNREATLARQAARH